MGSWRKNGLVEAPLLEEIRLDESGERAKAAQEMDKPSEAASGRRSGVDVSALRICRGWL